MELLGKLGINIDIIGYVTMTLLVFCIIMFIMIIILIIKQNDFKNKYNSLMTNNNGDNIEEVILSYFKNVEELDKKVETINKSIETMQNTLLLTYQKSGIVRYDAFKDMGGKLSFSLALLTEKNDGFIINSMHSTQGGCYTYIKEIINGQSYVQLSEEEKQALEIALGSKVIEN